MDKKKILSIIFFIVAIIIIAIMGYYIYKFYNEKVLTNTTNSTHNQNMSLAKNEKIISNTIYVEIKVQDTESIGLEYTKSVKIDDKKIIEELEDIVNNRTEYTTEIIYGSDIQPIVTFYLENGEEYEICANIENEDHICISKYDKNSDDFYWKKTYKIDIQLGEYLNELYNQFKNTNLINDSQEDLEKILCKYLKLYTLMEDGTPLLYSSDSTESYGLQLYNSYEEMEKDLVESNETININNQQLELYKTSIKYSEYKNEMLKYISEDLFEKQFTTYHKDIEGILYTISSPGEGKNYIIEDFNQIGRRTYEVKYKYYAGEAEPIQGTLKVKFLKDDKGNFVVGNCEFNSNEVITTESNKNDIDNENSIEVSYIILSIEDIEAEERNKQGIEEKSIKITNEQKIDSLMEIINNAKPYQEKSFIPDFGDCPPSAEIYLSNGEKYTISAGDNISDAGEEVNLMAKWDTEDGSNKLLYKVDIELGKYIEELFAEEENG